MKALFLKAIPFLQLKKKYRKEKKIAELYLGELETEMLAILFLFS